MILVLKFLDWIYRFGAKLVGAASGLWFSNSFASSGSTFHHSTRSRFVKFAGQLQFWCNSLFQKKLKLNYWLFTGSPKHWSNKLNCSVTLASKQQRANQFNLQTISVKSVASQQKVSVFISSRAKLTRTQQVIGKAAFHRGGIEPGEIMRPYCLMRSTA